MSRTVIFAVQSIIGHCHVKVDDDSLTVGQVIEKAQEMIDDNGVDEPSRGITFHENDDATENEHICKGVV